MLLATRTGCIGIVGDEFPVLFDQPGIFTATATLDGVTIGSMVISVAYVNFDGPIACQVGFKRQKGVEVYGLVDQIYFTAEDPELLEVSVKEQTEYGVRLYLKPLARGTPVVQARLGSVDGPVIAEQEIDEFTVECSASTHVVVDGRTGIGGATLTMTPWLPDLAVNFAMFSHYSTFAGGSTAFSVNTSGMDDAGNPTFEQTADPVTGEIQAVFRFEIGMPEGEDSYCFSIEFDQHSKYGTKVACKLNNGERCTFTPDPKTIYICEGCPDKHTLSFKEDKDNNTIHNMDHYKGHNHEMWPLPADADTFTIRDGATYNCTKAGVDRWDAKVKLTDKAKAGKEGKL